MVSVQKVRDARSKAKARAKGPKAKAKDAKPVEKLVKKAAKRDTRFDNHAAFVQRDDRHLN